MPLKPDRRTFVKTSAASTAALGVGFWAGGGVAAKPSISALEEIRFGCIGIDGKGSSDSADANNTERNQSKVIAICDIDEKAHSKFDKKFPGAKKYFDFRKMLYEMGKSIDAVTVSTPDHTHAVAALMAMDMGKHCFCQKPLTHSIEEARKMALVSKEKKLVTQMGNQGTALGNVRLSAALIRGGIIGKVKEVHCWTNRPVWPQSYGLKVQTGPKDDDAEAKEAWDARVKQVHWKEWIGPAKTRPYSPDYHNFKWRGFWDFGTGALGDMACHTLNMSFMALDLRDPLSVEAKTDKHDKNCFPKKSRIEFEFGEYKGRAPLKLFWYDGGELPPEDLLKDLPRYKDNEDNEHLRASGTLLVGEKGMFYSPGDYGGIVQNTGIVVDGEFTNQRRVEMKPDYPRSKGHFTEFTDAIRGEGTPMSNFTNYAGPLTETILLGNLAVWSGKKVIWDAKEMKAKDASPDVEKMIRHEYLNGYSIG